MTSIAPFPKPIRLTAKLKLKAANDALTALDVAMTSAGVTGKVTRLTVHKNRQGTGVWVGATIEDATGDQPAHLALFNEAKAKGVRLMFGFASTTDGHGFVSIPMFYPEVGTLEGARR